MGGDFYLDLGSSSSQAGSEQIHTHDDVMPLPRNVQCRITDDVCFVNQDSISHNATGQESSDSSASLLPAPLILLVGGGVGINPLASMFRHISHNIQEQELKWKYQEQQDQPHLPRVALLYSARTEEDLLFKVDTILNLNF